MDLNPAELSVLDRLLEARTGQRLNDSRYWRVASSVEEIMRAHGFRDTNALFALLTSAEGAGIATQIVEAMLNNETSFFRDRAMFRQLGAFLERYAEDRGQDRAVRLWSAGCSTGQEPYSIAIMTKDHGSLGRRPKPDILATDVSAAAIGRARQGQYSQFEIQRGLPVRAMIRDFTQEGEKWRINEDLRGVVRFRQHNLRDAPPGNSFDVILCRNVLFYFPVPTRAEVIDRLKSALVPGGMLVLGAGETLIGMSHGMEKVAGGHGLYRLSTPGDERTAFGG